MAYEISISGYALVSRDVLENKNYIKYCIKRETNDEFDSGWIFMSQKNVEKGILVRDDLEVIPYIDIINNVFEPTLYIYNMPVGTELQVINEFGRYFFVDNNSLQKIDLEKYLSFPVGSSIETALVKREGLLN